MRQSRARTRPAFPAEDLVTHLLLDDLLSLSQGVLPVSARKVLVRGGADANFIGLLTFLACKLLLA